MADKAESTSRPHHNVNHQEKKENWNHPCYQRMMNAVNDCNSIKYAAYRTASKLLILQKHLGLNNVRLGIIAGVFERYRMSTGANSSAVKSSQLEDIVSDIIFAALRERNNYTKSDESDSYSTLILNFLLNVYDLENRRFVNVFDIKVALVILSSSRLQDKLCFLFSLLADQNYLLPRQKFELLLVSFIAITNYLSESKSFSSVLIPSTVESLFTENQNFITENMFLEWFLKEPPLLIWLPTFYRLRAASNVSHNSHCHVCKMEPIIGLRYKCLRCLNYEQCQNCFFSAKISKKHRITHPMQEFCWQMSCCKTTLMFLKTILNKLCRRNLKLQYLPAQPSDSSNKRPPEQDELSHLTNLEETCHSITEFCKSVDVSVEPQQELQDIISQLEQVNRCLEDDMGSLCVDDKMYKYLNEHKSRVESQIQKLKQLKSYLRKMTYHRKPRRLASTPIVNKQLCHAQLCELSPICDRVADPEPSTISKEENNHVSDENFKSVSRNAISTWLALDPDNVSKTNEEFSDWLKPNRINFSCDDEHLAKINMVCGDSGLDSTLKIIGRKEFSQLLNFPLKDKSNQISTFKNEQQSNLCLQLPEGSAPLVAEKENLTSLDDSRIGEFNEIRSKGVRKPIRKQASINKLFKNDPNKITIEIKKTPKRINGIEYSSNPHNSQEVEKINQMLSELDDILIKLNDVIPGCN